MSEKHLHMAVDSFYIDGDVTTNTAWAVLICSCKARKLMVANWTENLIETNDWISVPHKEEGRKLSFH